MPAATYYQPIEAILDGKCDYEYYSHTDNTFSKRNKTRICHIQLNESCDYNRNIALLIFTIRNQSGAWKIHSEGIKRTDSGTMVPLRNATLKLAREKGWKFVALAVAGEDTPATENISQYVVSIESYTYGDETVGVLTDALNALNDLGNPDFYRTKITIGTKTYSFAFIKKEKVLEYLAVIDNRAYDKKQEEDENNSIDETDVFAGFESWLTSYNNPDYTGRQKYDGYPKALGRLVEFMIEQGLIDDSNLNDKNIEKYCKFLDVYDSSKVVREFDEKEPSSKAGRAALKKYIKYIEYLLNPHAENFNYAITAGEGENKIFFGTPGCGKSYYIEHRILGRTDDGYTGSYCKENIIRTTFYQDYSNTDFVGQILPKVVRGNEGEKDTVEYIFNPGPFTLALIQAISNPDEKVALVIEEINRGNAPAIFGDIFQLLDRDTTGISEYGIVNVSLMDYLNSLEFVVNGQKMKYNFSEIKIPGNMDIFATMNTSDQNVYTLDTAFIRRWEKEKIKNTFAQCTFAATAVPGMLNYTWKEFVDGINGWIVKHLEDLQVNEDKQIGVFFVKESLLVSGDPEKFAFKVFDYLWSDVAKLDHGIFFNPYDTLEDLINDYIIKGVGVFKPGIFEVKAVAQPQSEANNG